MYVELVLVSKIEKLPLELDLLPPDEAQFPECHRLLGDSKSISIDEYTTVGIKFNFNRNRKVLAIDRTLANLVVYIVIFFIFTSFVVFAVFVLFVVCRICCGRCIHRICRFGGTNFRLDFQIGPTSHKILFAENWGERGVEPPCGQKTKNHVVQNLGL